MKKIVHVLEAKIKCRFYHFLLTYKDHLLLPCTIEINRNLFSKFAFLDCGATNNFYNLGSAQKIKLSF